MQHDLRHIVIEPLVGLRWPEQIGTARKIGEAVLSAIYAAGIIQQL
jgi:hypothetical protein